MDHIYSKFWKHFKSKHSLVRKASSYSFANKFFDLAPPLLIGMAVDAVVNPHSALLSQWTNSIMGQLWIIAALSIIIWSAESYFEYLLGVAWRDLAQDVQHQLRQETYQHVQNLEMAYFENKSIGNLISILNDDVNQLERFLDRGANDIIQVTTTVIIIGCIFFWIAPIVAVTSFIPIPLILWGSLYFQRKIQPRYDNVRQEVGSLSSVLNNNLLGISTIKSFAKETHEMKRIEDYSLSYSAANRHAIRLSSAFSPLIRMVILGGFLAAMLLGGNLVIKNELAIGSYSVLIFMTQRLLWPLTTLGVTFDLLQRAKSSTKRIFELLETPVKIKGGTFTSTLENHQIEFKDVNFSYIDDINVLCDFNLKIHSGETIGIVGTTGSGKSTLVKLLLRFYDINSGEILVSGRPIQYFDLSYLRSQFAYVSQDTYLFPGTIYDNILYANENATKESVYRAAKQAEVDTFIEALPNGYDTLVGERGVKLSGGQKQRLAIARAILKDSPIYIFDEATSSVDNETEAALKRSIHKITQNKTTLIIAHRLSTVVHADQIYVLDKGSISEVGTHLELIERQGQYKKLWDVQTGNINNLI